MADRKQTKLTRLYDGFRQRAAKTTAGVSALGRFIGKDLAIRYPVENLGVISTLESMAQGLVSDMWIILFDQDAEVVYNDRMSYYALFSHDIIEWLLKQDSFRELRNITRNLPLTSAEAAVNVFETLFQDRQMANMMTNAASGMSNDKPVNKNGNTYDNDNRHRNEQDKNDNSKGDGGNKNQQGQQGQQPEKSARQKMKDDIKKIDNPLMGGMLSKLTRDAKEKASQYAYAMKTWGLEQGDEPNNINLQDLRDLISANYLFTETMSTLLGRFEGIGNDTLEKAVNSQTGAIAEVALTRDIMQTFPIDRVYLMSNQVPQFARARSVSQWASHGLQGWQKKSSANRMGSFVAMIDGSGSMSGMAVAIAKSLALGIAKVVTTGDVGRASEMDEKRRWALCEFSASSDFLWLEDNASARESIYWATHHYDGGTDITEAMRRMNRKISEFIKEGVVGVDALIITDSQASIEDNSVIEYMKELKKLHGVRLFYVQIGNYKMLKAIEDISEEVLIINESDLEDTAQKLTVTIVKSLIRGSEESLQAVI